MIASFLAWYLIVQLIALAALPLTLRLFAYLPDRGYAFAKSLGILLVGVVLWLGASYGLMRNEVGGAWLALLVVAVGSLALAGYERSETRFLPRDLVSMLVSSWRYVLIVEILFLVTFVWWATVRAYDPAANHTEKPMDLMFMNSIWASPTYPPHDAWLSGYAISYYYLGYWLLAMLGRLAGQAPEIAYNLGQACWYGLLIVGCFGVVFNLLADAPGEPPITVRHRPSALLGGLLASVAVGVTGNLQGIVEWLYANGLALTRLVDWLDVYNFPGNASATGQWYIGFDWWWWRSSRVIEDLDLLGQHIEVIDEFPFFSYILGDNHPHVLAMPFVLLAIALALNLFLRGQARLNADGQDLRDLQDTSQEADGRASVPTTIQRLSTIIPLGWIGLILLVVSLGALVFLNTWDFPPYWLLMVLCVFIADWWALRGQSSPLRSALISASLFGALVLLGSLALYLPYFLAAQSQVSGVTPNLFHPTHFPQFLLMYGAFLPAICALIGLSWSRRPPGRDKLVISFTATLGLPLAFLLMSLTFALGTESGRRWLSETPLPQGASSYLPIVLERWGAQFWTFLIVGALLAATLALVWQRVQEPRPEANDVRLSFALLLAGIGLLLVYLPEFVYLRDNFGTRMNTVFKFYYQGWLLLGLSSAYVIAAVGQTYVARRATAAAPVRSGRRGLWVWVGLAAISLLLIVANLIYPVAGVYSKTMGFSAQTPVFDATAYLAAENPDEMAAVKWVRDHVPLGAVVLEGKGASYWPNYNRMSTMTGRPTLLGWDGHEAQWRGQSYGQMAQGRVEAMEKVYRSGALEEIAAILDDWGIDYVYVGPSERNQYGITPRSEERLAAVMDAVFESGDVRIYRRRGVISEE